MKKKKKRKKLSTTTRHCNSEVEFHLYSLALFKFSTIVNTVYTALVFCQLILHNLSNTT